MKLVVLIITALFPFATYSAETYVCTAEKSTGFAYDRTTKSWSTASFAPDKAFVISKSAAGEYKWVVKEAGTDLPHMYCQNDFTSAGLLFCVGHVGQELRFSNRSLRFLASYTNGYWDENALESLSSTIGKTRQEGDDTPAMYIGKCGKL